MAARSPVRGHGARSRRRPMGSQVSCASFIVRAAGLAHHAVAGAEALAGAWAGAGAGQLQPWLLRARARPRPAIGPAPSRLAGAPSWGRWRSGTRRTETQARGATARVAWAGRRGAAGSRGADPGGGRGAELPDPLAPWHLRQPLRPPGSLFVTFGRGIFQLVISAASTPGPRRQPGGVPAPPARAALCVPRPRSRAAPGPTRAEFAKSQNCGTWALGVLGVIVSPEVESRSF